MKWTKLKVHINPMAVEAMSDSLLGLGIEGIEIEDNFLSDGDRRAMFIDYTDEHLVPLDEYRIVAYLDESMDIEEMKTRISLEVQRLREFLEVGSGIFSIEEMPEEDYENKWKEFYQPFKVGDHMIITPIWETPESEEGDTVVRIDPGMAFGSGTHETTSLCVEFLLEQSLSDKKVVDVGCGSGILGIVAAKLGASDVLGIDIDENAVTIAAENVLSNDVASVMSVAHGDLLDQVQCKVDVIVANILADVIIHLTPTVKAVLLKGGTFISSGILVSRIPDVTEALEANGYRIEEVREKGEWAAIQATYVGL